MTPGRDGAVFAGGRGSRIGGDKAFVRLAGRPLAVHVIEVLAPQVDRILIVARTTGEAERLIERLAGELSPTLAARLLPAADRPGIEGPVAALLGAADAATARTLLTVPVDAPFLPADLGDRLAAAGPAAIAVGEREHPTCLHAGAAAVAALPPAWSLRATLAPLSPVPVRLPEAALFNINTPDDLAQAEAILARR